MVIYSKGNPATDKSGYEIREHGTTSFPIACYYRKLDEDAVNWHYHTEFELLSNVSGKATVLVPEAELELQAGDVCFINSGELHSVTSPPDGNNQIHSLVFAPRLIGAGTESVFHIKYIKPLTESSLRYAVLRDEAASSIIEAVYQECLDEGIGYELRIRNSLTTLFIELLKLSGAQETRQSESEIRNERRIKQMLSFIQENVAEPIEVEDIARAANISRRECLRCFRQTLGTTPSKYLSDFRLEKAADMLRATKLKIIDISVECGFEDTSYFTRVFTKKYSCPPREFRKKEQE